jgi:hypothetical protein
VNRGAKRLAFWGAVGAVSLIAPLTLNIAADRLPFAGLKTLNAYLTRSNG